MFGAGCGKGSSQMQPTFRDPFPVGQILFGIAGVGLLSAPHFAGACKEPAGDG